MSSAHPATLAGELAPNTGTVTLPELEIRPAETRDTAACEAFVAAAPRASFFHQPRWGRAVRSVFGHEIADMLALRDGRVVGVVTDRDLALRICSEDIRPSTTLLSEVMSSGVISCRPEDPVTRAEALMRKHRITRVVVTRHDGSLAGVLSLSDLVFYEPPARMGRTLRAVAERKYDQGGPSSA